MYRMVMAVTLSVFVSIAAVGCGTGDKAGKSATASLGKPGENVLPCIDPKKEGSVVSLDTVEVVAMTVRNETKSAISLHWLDEGAGDRVYYKDVEPGAEVIQDTFKDHCWIVVDKGGKALGIYKTGDKDCVVVIR